MTRPLPFQDADERDESRGRVDRLAYASRDLASIRRDPALAVYVSPAGSNMLLLPSEAELLRARETLERVAACLTHLYDQRRRYGEDPDIASRSNRSGFEDDSPF